MAMALQSHAFLPTPHFRLHQRVPLYAEDSTISGDESSADTPEISPAALPPSETTASVPDLGIDPASAVASTAVMMNQNMRRVLIEELGYRRKEVDRMRVELAAPIIEKRMKCPPDGMPESWMISEEENSMLKKLENESKYPLKVPLLGVSLVVLGKGLSDAIITIIKVNTGFNGASFAEQFMGVPVIAIDLVCVVVGVALGTWTWRTMRD